MPTKWLQERAKGSKNEPGIPPHRAFCGSRRCTLRSTHTPPLPRNGPTQGPSWGYLKVNFSETLSTFGDKCPRNGSNNGSTAPSTGLGYPHIGPFVEYACTGVGFMEEGVGCCVLGWSRDQGLRQSAQRVVCSVQRVVFRMRLSVKS